MMNDTAQTAADAPSESRQDTLLVAGVQHRIAGEIYTFVSPDEELRIGDRVVVEGEHGESLGIVVVPPYQAARQDVPKNVRRILRRAADEDVAQWRKRREQAREYFALCEQKIADHGLPMKLVEAELVEDGKKVLFFFFAEQRVDFRGLVKDLASTVHKYIEMRQVGSRDASSFVGCMGPCGRVTCCSSFLRNFQSISIAMAKNQGLSPNPAKLTGMCGKLKCCLAYENKGYSEQKKGLPKHNSWVETPRGVGKVVKLDILKRQCAVRLETGGEVRCPCEECKPTASRQQDQRKKQQKQGDKKKRKQRDRQKSGNESKQ